MTKKRGIRLNEDAKKCVTTYLSSASLYSRPFLSQGATSICKH
jgi:hypothetical protein